MNVDEESSFSEDSEDTYQQQQRPWQQQANSAGETSDGDNNSDDGNQTQDDSDMSENDEGFSSAFIPAAKRPRQNFLYNGQQLDVSMEEIIHVTVHESVRVIRYNAFGDLSSLVEIVFPSVGLQEIASYAFSRCSSLLQVSIPVTVTKVGSGAFQHSTALTDVELASVQSIGSSAFKGCSSLTRVSIPSTLRVIEDHTFALCTALSDIEFSKGLVEVKPSAFVDCTSLTCISLPSTLQRVSGFENCSALTDVELNEGLISVANDAFAQCENLATIYIPSTVEGINTRGFEDCVALLEVVLPDGLRITGIQVFLGCRSLERVSIPGTLETLDHQLFKDCSSLVDVYLSEGLKRIESEAFSKCTSMTAIALPKSIECIGRRAFFGCTSLLGVQLSSATEYLVIESHAFDFCRSLVNIRVPPFLDESYSYDTIFSNCDGLCDKDVGSLQQRFADLPVHDACYQSSHLQIDGLVETINSCNPAHPHHTVEKEVLVDMFQMTPFHILGTSATLSSRLFEALLSKYPLNVVHQKDCHGNSMMDYLIQNQAANSSPLIQSVLQRAVIDRMNDWGLGLYRSALSTLVESTLFYNVDAHQTEWKKVKDTFSSQVKTEMATILELAVWKRNIHSFSADREGCRMMGGADVIPSSVIGFLWDSSTRIGFNFEDSLQRTVA